MGVVEEKIKENLIREANGMVEGIFELLSERMALEEEDVLLLIRRLNDLKETVYEISRRGKLL